MTVRLTNLPEPLKAALPETLVHAEADYVLLDPAGIAALAAGAEWGARMVDAYRRTLGAEAVMVVISELPEKLRAAAQALAVGAGALSGEALKTALANPKALPASVREALPELARVLQEKMGREARSSGVLSAPPSETRLTEGEISRLFAAIVEDIREATGGAPVQPAGAQKLIEVTKRVMLNRGGGIVTRAFYDSAVEDLRTHPGLSDDAVQRLAKFRLRTQPGLNSHQRTAEGALLQVDRLQRKKHELELLNPSQTKAIELSTERARLKVAAARKSLLAAIEPWGYKEADLDQLILYLERYAPLTIQVNPDRTVAGAGTVIDSLLADPHYKNQFQTKISGGSLCPTAGSMRDNWEREIFASAYHDHPLIPEERPKYGGFSPLNNPQGNGGSWYGKCFFELRQDVKWRTTFTPRNSSGCHKEDVTTIETLEVLLDQIRANDSGYLKELFAIATGEKVSIARNYTHSYLEAQIHGDLDLRQDVDFIVIYKSYLGTSYQAKLEQLAELTGATIKYTDDVKFSFPSAEGT